MGYQMRQGDTKLCIAWINFADALAAIKGLHGKETVNGKPSHFRWVDEDFYKTVSLYDIMKSWRWRPEVDDLSNNIVRVEFTGEKLGDDKILFDAIAPFVEAGSFIEMRGEDGTQWKWAFDGKICTEVTAETVWDDDETSDPEKLFNKWLEGMPEITISQGAVAEWGIIKTCYEGDATAYLRDSFRQFVEQQL